MKSKNFLIAVLESFSEDWLDKKSDEKIMEGVKPAFGSPGGKFFVAGKLIRLFPEHKSYVEAFIGGGSVLFRKNKQEGVPEFINDRDEEIAFAFRFMQTLTDEQLKTLESKNWTTKETIFKQLLATHKENDKAGDPPERFYRIAYLKAASDAGEMRSYDGRAEGDVMKVTTRLMKLKERLQGVTIENMDYREFVKKHATKESFTFLDPPYPSAKMNWKFCPSQEEFESFSKTVPGKWMITYEVCDGWKESGFNRKILSQYNLAAPSSGHMSRKSELVVSNYPLAENKESKLVDSVDSEMIDDIINFVSDININESMNIKEDKKIGNCIYNKQWWKPKFLESKTLDSFVLATDLGYDMYFNSNIFRPSGISTTMHIKPAKDINMKMVEAVDYMPPKSCELNGTIMPSWIKTLGSGKVSIKESSETERSIEISGDGVTGKFEATRDNANSDFWIIHKESKHSHDKCMKCSEPPKYELLWAEGMGHAWFCESHYKSWSKEHKGDIDSVKEVKEGKASNKFQENTNPNIL